MIKNIQSIEQMLNLEAGTLQKALTTDEEVEIQLPELVVRTKEEEAAFLANIDREKKERYDSGKEKAEKDKINALIPTLGIDLTDKAKTFENVAEALKAKYSKELAEPKDKQVQELLTDKEKLQKNLVEIETQFNQFKEQVTKTERNRKIDSVIESTIPNDGLLIPREDLKVLFKTKHEIELGENDTILIKKDGEVLKDTKTMNPRPVKDVMNEFIVSYVKKQEGGSGAWDDARKPVKGSYDAFIEEMQAKGVSTGSSEFMQEQSKRIKEGTLNL